MIVFFRLAKHIRMWNSGRMRFAACFAETVARVRAYREHEGMSRAELARRAGLHENALRDIDASSWRPRPDTLSKLEAIIPPSFRARKRRAA